MKLINARKVWKEELLLTLIISDVIIHDTTVYFDSSGHSTIHDSLSLCIVSSGYIVRLRLTYENNYIITKLCANIAN